MREVYEALRKTRPIAYTTVMTMMNVLEDKRYLEKKSNGRAHVYTPTKPRHQVVGAMVRDFVDRVFDGASGVAAAAPREGFTAAGASAQGGPAHHRGDGRMIPAAGRETSSPAAFRSASSLPVASLLAGLLQARRCRRALRLLARGRDACAWRCPGSSRTVVTRRDNGTLVRGAPITDMVSHLRGQAPLRRGDWTGSARAWPRWRSRPGHMARVWPALGLRRLRHFGCRHCRTSQPSMPTFSRHSARCADVRL